MEKQGYILTHTPYTHPLLPESFYLKIIREEKKEVGATYGNRNNYDLGSENEKLYNYKRLLVTILFVFYSKNPTTLL